VTLPKHLRQRWRYLGVGVETRPGDVPGRRAVQAALWESARGLLGDAGSATVDLTVVRYEPGGDGTDPEPERAADAEAVVRTRRGAVDRARAAVVAVSAVDGRPVGLRVRGVSGTVRGCEERYMGRAPIRTEQRHVALGTVSGRAVVRDGRVDVDGLGATTLDL